MPTPTQPTPRTEDLLIGVLAVLSLQRKETLKITDKVFHKAFGSALDVFRNAGGELQELADSYVPDVVSNTYDELNDALIAAESFHLLRFPNPSYSRLQITMTPRVAQQLLEKYPGQRGAFEQAAKALLDSMSGVTA
jgi:hypothetical protein